MVVVSFALFPRQGCQDQRLKFGELISCQGQGPGVQLHSSWLGTENIKQAVCLHIARETKKTDFRRSE